MANSMPVRICKGDRVRIKDGPTARKYNTNEEQVFTVETIDSVAGSSRLYVPHPQWPGEMTMLWARDCVLAWGKSSPERKKALGLI